MTCMSRSAQTFILCAMPPYKLNASFIPHLHLFILQQDNIKTNEWISQKVFREQALLIKITAFTWNFSLCIQVINLIRLSAPASHPQLSHAFFLHTCRGQRYTHPSHTSIIYWHNWFVWNYERILEGFVKASSSLSFKSRLSPKQNWWSVLFIIVMLALIIKWQRLLRIRSKVRSIICGIARFRLIPPVRIWSVTCNYQ